VKSLINAQLLKGLFVLSASALVAGSAFAAGSQTETFDSNGMPLCLLRADGNEFVRLEWKRDLYERDVYGEKMPRMGLVAQTGSQEVDLYQTYCQNTVRQDEGSASISKSRQKVTAGQTTVLGYTIDDATSALLAQVRVGGIVALAASEATPAQYLAAHPITTYTVELNREITQKYGMGFSAGVYKAFIESQPKNAALKARVMSYVSGIKPLDTDSKIADRFKGYTLAIVRGYAFNLGNNARYAAMIQDLIDAGFNVKVLDNTPYGTVDDNHTIVLQELKALIAQGQKVILIPASKGGPEALSAVSDLATEMGSDFKGVVAVISLSSMVSGSLPVDWAARPLIWPIIRPILYKEFNKQGGQLTSLSMMDSFKDMSTSYLTPFYEQHPIAVAKGPIYINLVGTPLGNGLAADPGVLQVQNSVIRPFLSKDCGASDGYVEFPGTEVPATDGITSYSLAFDASHVILDGSLEGHSMSDDGSRKVVLTSILSALGDMLTGSL
jgi:hypothetical protein